MDNSTSPCRILVVDDNKDAAELLQMLLQMENYDVQVAFDGASGLTKAFDFRPQVICSDLHMPVLSGFEFAVELRKSVYSRDAHLIAMTGLDNDETIRKVIASGFDLHMTKPLDIDKFSAYLRSFFERIERTK